MRTPSQRNGSRSGGGGGPREKKEEDAEKKEEAGKDALSPGARPARGPADEEGRCPQVPEGVADVGRDGVAENANEEAAPEEGGGGGADAWLCFQSYRARCGASVKVLKAWPNS